MLQFINQLRFTLAMLISFFERLVRGYPSSHERSIFDVDVSQHAFPSWPFGATLKVQRAPYTIIMNDHPISFCEDSLTSLHCRVPLRTLWPKIVSQIIEFVAILFSRFHATDVRVVYSCLPTPSVIEPYVFASWRSRC